jgi:hypothetical protein
MDPIEYLTHLEPVWRDRADFLIMVELPDPGPPNRMEQLWSRQLGPNRFEVCCIPFFAYDLALGDIVETSAKPDFEFIVERVLVPSGRYVFRVWFGDSFQPRAELTAELAALGGLVEWSSPNLVAIDAADEGAAQVLADCLAGHEALGHVVYETGRT